MFSKTFLVAAITGLATAAPTQLAPRDAIAYTLNVVNIGAPYNNAGITASSRNFWFYKDTQSSCPLASGCPDGYVTAVSHLANTTTLAMDVIVPGGQQVFVGPDNNLTFTGAHSNSAPVGSMLSGFNFAATNLGYSIVTMDKRFFSACPVGSTYQIVTVPSGEDPIEGCQFVGVIATPYSLSTPAWQYD